MQQNIIYIGLDVDDTQYHGSALNKQTGEVLEFACRPTLKALLNQLSKLKSHFPSSAFKLCYEASYVGYTLRRDLAQHGYNCDVVAPSSIPSPRGKQVKTDRIDAAQLAQFYANDLLTQVNVPDAEGEQDRDLLRSRQKIVAQQTELRTHIQALLRRQGLHYRVQCQHKTHWTKLHYAWLDRTVESVAGSLKINLNLLLHQLRAIDAILLDYDQQVECMAQSPRYQSAVKALTCYKGIKNHFALTMITEIGDIHRFDHPQRLVSWMGLDIREYSSGGKQHRFGITKQGNRQLRTAFVEANQRSYRSTKITKALAARRKDTDSELINIAYRCLHRINKKGRHLLLAGKPVNKVKVACAREMVGFVWESLRKVAA
jgi:transposase